MKSIKMKNKDKFNAEAETCPHVKAHRENKFNGSSQEQDTHNLNNNGCLFESNCSACEKRVVNKNKLSDEESLNETIFNNKCALFSFKCFRTQQDMCFTFCMCQKCYVEKNNSDSSKSRHSTRLR